MLEVLRAGGIETVLRAGGSSFCDVQLLSQVDVVGDKTREESLRERACASAAGVWIPADWICGDAESCACADERAGEGDGIDGAANVEAAGIAKDAEAKKARTGGAVGVRVWRRGRRVAVILASAVL